eukprot:9710161-Ditylum_brightwellii.AAC.1
MYSGFKLKFTVGATTKEIPYTIGGHQGDNLTLLLFNIIFQAALDLLKLIWEHNLLSIPNFCFSPLPSLEFLTVAWVVKASKLEKSSPLRNLYT